MFKKFYIYDKIIYKNKRGINNFSLIFGGFCETFLLIMCYIIDFIFDNISSIITSFSSMNSILNSISPLGRFLIYIGISLPTLGVFTLLIKFFIKKIYFYF